jgi:hypothetical protein
VTLTNEKLAAFSGVRVGWRMTITGPWPFRSECLNEISSTTPPPVHSNTAPPTLYYTRVYYKLSSLFIMGLQNAAADLPAMKTNPKVRPI